MTITIKTIPHNTQRYPTAADWQFDANGDLLVLVSQTRNWKYNALLGVHELIEALLCKHHGITQAEVDEFDIAFEKDRLKGDLVEPGDSLRAPYRDQHCFATAVERMLCAALGVPWSVYDTALDMLDDATVNQSLRPNA